MRRARHVSLRLALWLGCALTASCTSASAPDLPATVENVAGSYEATSFTGGGYDVLALGGSLNLTLGIDGSVAGGMHIPADAGGPLDFDMAGTYTLTGDALTFQQDADTFVRDAAWTWSNNVLSGEWSGGGGSASMRLEKSDG